MSSTADKFDPYQAITDQIIALLEKGTAPWRMPWDPALGLPRSLTTGKPYRGINPFLLQMSALEQGFQSPYWATYKAISERGGQVRKGEHGTLIMFWKKYLGKELDEQTGKPKPRFVMRVYKVFNTDQADNLPVPVLDKTSTDHDPIETCEAAIAGYIESGPAVSFGASLAGYAVDLDALIMPARTSFGTAEEFYSTFFHELTHSTGHPDRLARPDLMAHTHFGDKRYSKEELVAEMGAAMLAGQTGIAAATLENSANYLGNWLKVLRADNKLVVQAAAQAQRAADMILGVSWAQEAEATEPQMADSAA